MVKQAFSSAARSAIVLTAVVMPAAAWADSSAVISSQEPGPTQFIEFVRIKYHSTASLTSVQFTITPVAGSYTRPISATYSAAYMVARGYWNGTSGRLRIPVFGLYAGATNTVPVVLSFSDGSTVTLADTVTTAAYVDSCNALNNGQVVASNRKATSDLSFDYMLLKKNCDTTGPTLMDTDGYVRWIGTGKVNALSVAFYQNQFYISNGKSAVLLMNFDGKITRLADYAGINVTNTNHHNYDTGRDGLILDVNTTTDSEAVDLEIDAAGNVLHNWDFGQIISAAMTAGGDDPTKFVGPSGTDWFHNNASTYNPADNTLIASSRENFVIAVDYDTQQIKWILGDKRKHWYQFPSLRQYALTLAPGTLAPIGQHAVSIDTNGNLLLYDDGFKSIYQVPTGPSRGYSTPRAYRIDTTAKTATEVFDYTQHDKIYTQICGSIYEDAPGNYLIDYATEDFRTKTELVGLAPVEKPKKKIFDYIYPDVDVCGTTWNTQVIHLENLQF